MCQGLSTAQLASASDRAVETALESEDPVACRIDATCKHGQTGRGGDTQGRQAGRRTGDEEEKEGGQILSTDSIPAQTCDSVSWPSQATIASMEASAVPPPPPASCMSVRTKSGSTVVDISVARAVEPASSARVRLLQS